MARANVTKATVKRLYEAATKSRPYSDAKRIAYSLLLLAGRLGGLDKGFEYKSEYSDEVCRNHNFLIDNAHRMHNSFEGVQILCLTDEEWQLCNSLSNAYDGTEEFHFAGTHGLNALSIRDFNKLVKDVLGNAVPRWTTIYDFQ